ncbi:hypothetical protein [Novosphingobium humi]|uniref:DUF4231 domain-containing protein n=1 Tax=Novosphingobium humi TaxID=2282397 RepID=A0ABY7TZF8_9SPHN|nr:hypothetical protein [Novosphingobium humi]WCT78652.1 hypothetical protein PQ457_06730 [Novosphingobium humi]
MGGQDISQGVAWIRELGRLMPLDRYEAAARLAPAMLATAPVSVSLVLLFPRAWKLLSGAAASMAVSTAIILLLMHFGRASGRAVQQRIVERDGGLASTVALRHRDAHLSIATKARYHAALRGLGLELPTPEEEALDPRHADDLYRSAVDWLRERTRDEKQFRLLQSENRSYGFRRNLLGLKPAGLVLNVLCFGAVSSNLWLMSDLEDDRRIAAIILVLLLAGATIAWLFVVTEAFVMDASWAYTDRLLACSEVIPRKPRRTKTTTT